MMKGSGSGSVPVTNETGSGRPKSIQILIHNTAFQDPVLCSCLTFLLSYFSYAFLLPLFFALSRSFSFLLFCSYS